jgi:hypothetical protein
MNSSSSSASSKVNETFSKNPDNGLVTINEKVNLTKDQLGVLNIICNMYQISISQYMQEALVEAMKFDIEEGNLCDTLLEKIDDDNKKGNNSPSSPSPNSMNGDVNMFKELQA